MSFLKKYNKEKIIFNILKEISETPIQGSTTLSEMIGQDIHRIISNQKTVYKSVLNSSKRFAVADYVRDIPLNLESGLHDKLMKDLESNVFSEGMKNDDEFIKDLLKSDTSFGELVEKLVDEYIQKMFLFKNKITPSGITGEICSIKKMSEAERNSNDDEERKRKKVLRVFKGDDISHNITEIFKNTETDNIKIKSEQWPTGHTIRLLLVIKNNQINYQKKYENQFYGIENWFINKEADLPKTILETIKKYNFSDPQLTSVINNFTDESLESIFLRLIYKNYILSKKTVKKLEGRIKQTSSGSKATIEVSNITFQEFEEFVNKFISNVNVYLEEKYQEDGESYQKKPTALLESTESWEEKTQLVDENIQCFPIEITIDDLKTIFKPIVKQVLNKDIKVLEKMMGKTHHSNGKINLRAYQNNLENFDRILRRQFKNVLNQRVDAALKPHLENIENANITDAAHDFFFRWDSLEVFGQNYTSWMNSEIMIEDGTSEEITEPLSPFKTGSTSFVVRHVPKFRPRISKGQQADFKKDRTDKKNKYINLSTVFFDVMSKMIFDGNFLIQNLIRAHMKLVISILQDANIHEKKLTNDDKAYLKNYVEEAKSFSETERQDDESSTEKYKEESDTKINSLRTKASDYQKYINFSLTQTSDTSGPSKEQLELIKLKKEFNQIINQNEYFKTFYSEEITLLDVKETFEGLPHYDYQFLRDYLNSEQGILDLEGYLTIDEELDETNYAEISDRQIPKLNNKLDDIIRLNIKIDYGYGQGASLSLSAKDFSIEGSNTINIDPDGITILRSTTLLENCGLSSNALLADIIFNINSAPFGRGELLLLFSLLGIDVMKMLNSESIRGNISELTSEHTENKVDRQKENSTATSLFKNIIMSCVVNDKNLRQVIGLSRTGDILLKSDIKKYFKNSATNIEDSIFELKEIEGDEFITANRSKGKIHATMNYFSQPIRSIINELVEIRQNESISNLIMRKLYQLTSNKYSDTDLSFFEDGIKKIDFKKGLLKNLDLDNIQVYSSYREVLRDFNTKFLTKDSKFSQSFITNKHFFEHTDDINEGEYFEKFMSGQRHLNAAIVLKIYSLSSVIEDVLSQIVNYVMNQHGLDNKIKFYQNIEDHKYEVNFPILVSQNNESSDYRIDENDLIDVLHKKGMEVDGESPFNSEILGEDYNINLYQLVLFQKHLEFYNKKLESLFIKTPEDKERIKGGKFSSTVLSPQSAFSFLKGGTYEEKDGYLVLVKDRNYNGCAIIPYKLLNKFISLKAIGVGQALTKVSYHIDKNVSENDEMYSEYEKLEQWLKQP